MSSQLTRNQKLTYAIFAGAALSAMSFTMPACPGQQAMQEQIDAVKSSQQEMSGRLRGLESQLKQAAADSAAAKQAADQLNATLAAQKSTMDGLAASVQQLTTQVAALSKAPAKGKSTAKRRR